MYTCEPGRVIAYKGTPIATLHKVGNDSKGYTLRPVDADALARRIVTLLNAEDVQPIAIRELDYEMPLGSVTGG